MSNPFESLNVFLIHMVTILVISAKFATPAFLKIKGFWNMVFDVIFLVHDAANKVLSPHSKLSNSSISMRDTMITSSS